MDNDSLFALISAVAVAVVFLMFWRVILAGLAVASVAVFAFGLAELVQVFGR